MSIETLISVLFFPVLFMFYELYEYHRFDNIFKKVTWIANKSTQPPDYNDCYGDKNLAYYINTKNEKYAIYRINRLTIEKFPLTIPDEYKIDFTSEQERLQVSEILESYRRNELDKFFKEDRISTTHKHKAIYKLKDHDYFMFSLFCYLQNCVDYDSYLFRDKIYEDRKYIDNSYFSCQLTSYGRMCYKIYLVASMYCENNDFMKALILQSPSEHIMEYLKTNRVKFWSYRH